MVRQDTSYTFVNPPFKSELHEAGSEPATEEKAVKKAAIEVQNDISYREFAYLKRDLIKISIFTFFAIFLTSMLYYLVYRP